VILSFDFFLKNKRGRSDKPPPESFPGKGWVLITRIHHIYLEVLSSTKRNDINEHNIYHGKGRG
jgi:hypothetical protein